MAALEYGALAVSMGALGLVAKLVLAKRNGNGATRVLEITEAKEASEMLVTLREMDKKLGSINGQLATRTFCPYDSRRIPGDMP
jgi:hypothetical protein